MDKDRILIDSELVYCIGDIHPVSKGHSLVIPKVHVQNYFDLERVYRIAAWDMVDSLKKLLQEKYSPDGYNVGLNINPVAGQSVLHAHIHVIPRYIKSGKKNYAIENMAQKDF